MYEITIYCVLWRQQCSDVKCWGNVEQFDNLIEFLNFSNYFTINLFIPLCSHYWWNLIQQTFFDLVCLVMQHFFAFEVRRRKGFMIRVDCSQMFPLNSISMKISFWWQFCETNDNGSFHQYCKTSLAYLLMSRCVFLRTWDVNRRRGEA